MKILIIVDWFSENMGYAENCLPKALALLGHDVHLITSTAQIYYNHPHYNDIYRSFLGKNIVEPVVKKNDGYILYRLPFKNNNGIKISGLRSLLFKIKPDLVQTFDVVSHSNFILAIYKPILKYKLFTGNHVVASVFPPARENVWAWNSNYYFKSNILIKCLLSFLFAFVKSKKYSRSLHESKKLLINSSTEICYGATLDAAEIAVRFYGVPKEKIKVCELGVDTEIFFPEKYNCLSEESQFLRKNYGCGEQDVLCIYTGRFVEDKNPLCLAKAIDYLNSMGKSYKALFIGDGPQREEILCMKSCFTIDFRPFNELASYYRAADIGVWPREESTSMLDASSCGLPIIVSDKVQAQDRIEGNGMIYKENSHIDLARVLLKLENSNERKFLGRLGVEKIKGKYTWDLIAKNRIRDFDELKTILNGG